MAELAQAQPAGADARAKAHNAAAERHFSLGEFRQAAAEYKEAYKARPLPAFLHNLGQCYKRMMGLQNLEKALFYFESYLNNSPDVSIRGDVEREIAELKQRIDELRHAAAASEPAEHDAPGTSRTETVAALRPAAHPAKPPATPRARPFYKRWWFWTIVGVAVTGGAAAAVWAGAPGGSEPGVEGSIAPGRVAF